MDQPVTQAFCGERHRAIEDKLIAFTELRHQESTAQAVQAAAMLAGMDALRVELAMLNARLLKDNGHRSIQSITNDNKLLIATHQEAITAIWTKLDRFGWWIFAGLAGAGAAKLVGSIAGLSV